MYSCCLVPSDPIRSHPTPSHPIVLVWMIESSYPALSIVHVAVDVVADVDVDVDADVVLKKTSLYDNSSITC